MAEFVPDALRRGCDGALIRDVELEGVRASAPTLFVAVSSWSRLRDPTSMVKRWAARSFAV